MGNMVDKFKSLETADEGGARWLWTSRIPIGSLTLIDGDPGLGKSMAVLDWAARVTRGRAWPFGVQPPPEGGVVVIHGEDRAAMVKRRLLDHDADIRPGRLL